VKITDLTLDDVKQEVFNSVTSFPYSDRIIKVGLFGSFARGEADEKSDLDFVIDFKYKYNTAPENLDETRHYFMFEEVLQKAFAPTELSIVSLNGLKPNSDFKEQVEKDVVWIYG